MDAADALGRRILVDGTLTAPGTRIGRMFDLILNAPPADAERERFLAFVGNSEKRLTEAGDTEPVIRALLLACQAICSSSRFQFLD